MRIILLLFTIIISLQLTGCGTTEPPPQKEKPPGYQEDIPWASLADSPWPISYHDPQSTGRSKSGGPILGDNLWEFGNGNQFFAGITVGPDSTIYTIADDTNGVFLFAITPKGKLIFKNLLLNSYLKHRTAAIIRKDGSILCYDGVSTLFAFNSDGSLRWKYESGFFTRDKSFNIDKNGYIYFMAEPNKLVAITSSGELSWEFEDERISGFFSKKISFSPDGKTIYIPGNNVAVAALDMEIKRIKWAFNGLLASASILVDSEGNIYFEKLKEPDYLKSNFISVKPNGELRWEYKNSIEPPADSSPTIDKNGNIYFGVDTLYSVNYDGKLRWKIGLDGRCDAPIVSDNLGNIYVITTSIDPDFTLIYKISERGSVIWTHQYNSMFETVGSPAIGFDNIMLIPIANGKILCIR
jgi:hypothetical protein